MKKVYLSYDNNDEIIAEKIKEDLQKNNIKVTCRKDIKCGEHLLKETIINILNSNVVVSLVSKKTINSQNFQMEIDLILSFFVNKKFKWCFIKIDDVNVDDVHPILSSYAYIDFSNNKDYQIILEDILKKLK